MQGTQRELIHTEGTSRFITSCVAGLLFSPIGPRYAAYEFSNAQMGFTSQQYQELYPSKNNNTVIIKLCL